MLTQQEQREMHIEQTERARALEGMAAAKPMTYEIQRCSMRELRTALLVWDKAEYSGGRERAAGFLAAVVRDALVNFND